MEEKRTITVTLLGSIDDFAKIKPGDILINKRGLCVVTSKYHKKEITVLRRDPGSTRVIEEIFGSPENTHYACRFEGGCELEMRKHRIYNPANGGEYLTRYAALRKAGL